VLDVDGRGGQQFLLWTIESHTAWTNAELGSLCSALVSVEVQVQGPIRRPLSRPHIMSHLHLGVGMRQSGLWQEQIDCKKGRFLVGRLLVVYVYGKGCWKFVFENIVLIENFEYT
jgi:hypothetical protein